MSLDLLVLLNTITALFPIHFPIEYLKFYANFLPFFQATTAVLIQTFTAETSFDSRVNLEKRRNISPPFEGYRFKTTNTKYHLNSKIMEKISSDLADTTNLNQLSSNRTIKTIK